MRPVRHLALTSLTVTALLVATTTSRAQQQPPEAPSSATSGTGGAAGTSPTTPGTATGLPAAAPAASTGDPAVGATLAADGAAAPAGPIATSAAPASSEPTSIRLRSLEQRVQALKEKSWRVKARVDLLKEAVLGGGIGARSRIVHENSMGAEFKLVKLVYALDGTQIYAKTDESGRLDSQKKIEILSGPVEPGNHTISLLAVYHGSGFGLFPYMKGIKVTVRSSHTFTASEGKLTEVIAHAYKQGGLSTPFEKQPAVNFKVNITSGTQSATKGN